LTASKISSPQIFQKFWKKAGLKPSGPRDLSGCIWNKAIRVSSLVMGASKKALSSAETLGVIRDKTGSWIPPLDLKSS
jgi:hypothetical protein